MKEQPESKIDGTERKATRLKNALLGSSGPVPYSEYRG